MLAGGSGYSESESRVEKGASKFSEINSDCSEHNSCSRVPWLAVRAPAAEAAPARKNSLQLKGIVRNMARQLFTATLARSMELSVQTKHLEFSAQELRTFEFIAGQFVSMTAPKEGREITRAYSIASPPREDSTFDICLNRVPGGFFSN